MYVCIYKTNGVTSTCTQNKLHTTHLQIPSLTSLCKNIYNQHNIMIHYCTYICVHVQVYHINNINYIILIILRLSEVSYIRHVLTLINTYDKWYLIILTNL